MSSVPASADVLRKGQATISDYDAVAAGFDAGNANHDVSQNMQALLKPLLADAEPGMSPALDILDLGCAGGRDLLEFAR
eukprot:CAMPEP_0197671624 /NCGR_PEP_ID=MMETSP1338-20131121/77054_1 /TAXON_ID=43686 ORGANISM="Pelagodinium beii, Strain RCC1491" /NCGR_SAMPLE_ID=MMETSP1338 /ASSEMBLY_ACC=CAM_ASM_000754 /LENGTH=78 /DNA_ID=CAMNT_0043251553 /DNA_START=116 /DNA_END=349 /DNA_ORIENTATION=+